jgi:RNA polymerase sigma-70 factor (sigma-E family)
MRPDPAADRDFRQFVAARSRALQRTAYLLTGDWGHAEDLVQTTLMKTYLAWLRLGKIESVEAYTRTVMVNTATSWWRRRWHGERPAAVFPDRAAPDTTEDFLEQDRVWRFVSRLPPRQRAVLVLRYYEDLTEAETARMMGISVGTVKSHTARALTALRRWMGSPVSEGSQPTPCALVTVPLQPVAIGGRG